MKRGPLPVSIHSGRAFLASIQDNQPIGGDFFASLGVAYGRWLDAEEFSQFKLCSATRTCKNAAELSFKGPVICGGRFRHRNSPALLIDNDPDE